MNSISEYRLYGLPMQSYFYGITTILRAANAQPWLGLEHIIYEIADEDNQ